MKKILTFINEYETEISNTVKILTASALGIAVLYTVTHFDEVYVALDTLRISLGIL